MKRTAKHLYPTDQEELLLNEFAKQLTRLRKKQGLSQLRISNLIGILRCTYAKWESREAIPNLLGVIRLANLFEVSIEDLLSPAEESPRFDEGSKLGERIRELRHQHSMGVEELAETLRMSPSSISNWESGNSYPSESKLKALSEFFGVPEHELTFGTSGKVDRPFAENPIKVLRKKHGMTQVALADLLEVHPTALREWERGYCAPSPAQIHQLADLFDIPEQSLKKHFTVKDA